MMNLRREQVEVLTELERDATKLAAEARDYADAKASKASAEDDVLAEVLKAAGPALPAVSSKIVLINGKIIRALQVGPAAYLREDGRFVDGDGREVSVLAVSDAIPISTVLGILLVAIRAQLGKLGPRTEQIRREASILEGIAAAFKIGGVR